MEAIVLLIYPAVSDCREKAYYLFPEIIVFILTMAVKVAREGAGAFSLSEGMPGVACGCIPGLCFLVLSRMSPGNIGEGDGVILLLLGILSGFGNTLLCCLLALAMTTAAGMAVWAATRHVRNVRLPYLPFLLAAQVTLQLLRMT